MFTRIMAPVDLTNTDALARALQATADLARVNDIPVVYVSATNNTPSDVAHTPEEFEERLREFAEAQAKEHGIETSSHALVLKDRRADLDDALVSAADELGADLVVMASHDPTFFDHFWASNGGAVARASKASVMIVRGK